MSRNKRDILSRERWLTERICRDLDRHKLSFEREAVCRFNSWDLGYVDILLHSEPVTLIEVKGGSRPSWLYSAIGQLLCYASCFITPKLYIAVPQDDLPMPRIVDALRNVNIGLWGSAEENCPTSLGDVPMKTHRPCDVCSHPDRHAIEGAMVNGVRLGVIGAQRRIAQDILLDHFHFLMDTNVRMEPEDTTTSASNDAPLPVRRPVAPALLQAAEQARRDDALYHRRPLAMVQEAWQEAKGDEAERARIVAWLNEQLQADGREF